MDISGQKQIRFYGVYQLRSGILFAFARKRSTPWVTTITVFDTDRGKPRVSLYLKYIPTFSARGDGKGAPLNAFVIARDSSQASKLERDSNSSDLKN